MSQVFTKGRNQFTPSSLSFKRAQPTQVTQAGQAKSAPTPASDAAVLQKKIRDLSVKIEQIRGKLKSIQEKRKKTLAPAYRQTADQQTNQLKKQMQALRHNLHSCKSQDRAALLKMMVPNLEKDRDTLSQYKETFKESLPDLTDIKNHLDRISQKLEQKYTSGKIFPNQESQTFINNFIGFYIQKLECFNQTNNQVFKEAQSNIQSLRHELDQYKFVSNDEKNHLQRMNLIIDQVGGYYFALLELAGKTEPIVEKDTPVAADPGVSAARESMTAMKEKVGDLEVKFDFGSKKSVVHNQLGISVNQEKKSYQAYLDEGFQCIDLVVDSEFKNMAPFQQAIEAFLEAISQNKEKHEAYFGLGYLYSLVRDVNHSLYFLDIAYKISSSPSIKEFMLKVKSSYGVDK